jgi:protein TonB
MKLKQIPLVLVVALAHAGGLAMLAMPRSIVEDTPPVLLSLSQIEIAAAPQEQAAPQPPQPVVAKAPAPVQQQNRPAEVAKAEPRPQPVSAPPVAAESLVADSAPAAPAPMAMAAAESKPAPAANPAPVAAPAAAAPVESQPSFQADYLKNPKPDYPSRSMALGEEGRVMLRVHVSERGEPVRVEIVRSSGFPRLDEAARRTVERGWRFAPARRGDQAVAGVVQVPISFALRG